MGLESVIGTGLGAGFSFACSTLFSALLAALLSLLEAVGLALDLNDLRVVHQAVDQGDDTGGIGNRRALLGIGRSCR